MDWRGNHGSGGSRQWREINEMIAIRNICSVIYTNQSWEQITAAENKNIHIRTQTHRRFRISTSRMAAMHISQAAICTMNLVNSQIHGDKDPVRNRKQKKNLRKKTRIYHLFYTHTRAMVIWWWWRVKLLIWTCRFLSSVVTWALPPITYHIRLMWYVQ